MMMTRRKGFTLIELLVVIAIIGILAAMLFPVFAKARESARKTACLANVKNIAMAYQMYLADWDRFPPSESNRRAIDYFNTAPGGGTPVSWPDICNHAIHANPYLRQAVALDDYLGNREVWRCPSATLMNGAQFIVPAGPNGDYVQHYIDHQGNWGKGHWDDSGGPCYPAFPPGWGGDVTDSMGQMKMAMAYGYGTGAVSEGVHVFVQGISTYSDILGVNPSAIKDPSWYIVCGDGGTQVEMWCLNQLMFPDWCRSNCCGWCSGYVGCCNADWANCDGTDLCGIPYDYHVDSATGNPGRFWTDIHLRKQFTRHLGGSNVGFADGHAKWYPAEALADNSLPMMDPPKIENMCYNRASWWCLP